MHLLQHCLCTQDQQAAKQHGWRAKCRLIVLLSTTVGRLVAGLVSVLLAAGVEFGAMRATVTGALLRVIGTALALWIPLTPLFFIMRRALNGKTNSRCAAAGLAAASWGIMVWDCAVHIDTTAARSPGTVLMTLTSHADSKSGAQCAFYFVHSPHDLRRRMCLTEMLDSRE
jgi:hypothetical protein